MANLKSIAEKLTSVAATTPNPLLLIMMGYISNALLMLENQVSDENVAMKKALRVAMYGVLEFEPELRAAVIASPTPYDDRLVDELLEVANEILTPETS